MNLGDLNNLSIGINAELTVDKHTAEFAMKLVEHYCNKNHCDVFHEDKDGYRTYILDETDEEFKDEIVVEEHNQEEPDPIDIEYQQNLLAIKRQTARDRLKDINAYPIAQNDMAKRLGVQQSKISSWINGRLFPNDEQMEAIKKWYFQLFASKLADDADKEVVL